MIRFYFLSALLLLSFNVFAQINTYVPDSNGCPVRDDDPGNKNVYFETQAEVNTFLTTYAECTQLEGELSLYSYDKSDPITNLGPFENLTSIAGMLNVASTNVKNLLGLNNVSSLGGSFGM